MISTDGELLTRAYDEVQRLRVELDDQQTQHAKWYARARNVEARLNAVIALCADDGPDVIWDEGLTVAYVLADAARAAATGVTP